MSFQLPQTLKQTATTMGISLLCLLAIVFLQKPKLTELVNRSKTLSKEEIEQALVIEKIQLDFLQKLPSFGFDNLMADWVFLKFLQYFGDEPARSQTNYMLSADYLGTVIDRDPRFLDAYLFLSIASSIYSATPDRSVEIMSKGASSLKAVASPQLYSCLSMVNFIQKLATFGLKNPTWEKLERLPFCNRNSLSSIAPIPPHFSDLQAWLKAWAASDYHYAWDYPEEVPKYYYIWRYKGIDYFLFLGNIKAAERSFLTAANKANLYNLFYTDPVSEKIAVSSQGTAEFIAQNPYSKAAQIRAWMLILGHVPDDRTKRIAIEKIQSLGGEFITDAQGNVILQMPPED